jgi:hypothetical protein
VNGEHDKSEVSYLNVKCEKEVRLCLRCALVSDTERGEEGRQAVPFDNSGKVVLPIKDWMAQAASTEIARVKSLPQGGVDWVLEGGPAGTLYKDKTVQKLIYVGGTIMTRLEEKNMKILTEEQVKIVATQVKGIWVKKLLLAWNQAQQFLPEPCPGKIDSCCR